MNFEWKNNIYKNDSSNNESDHGLDDDTFPSVFPRYCKVIGLIIAFLPVIYKIAQLKYPPLDKQFHIREAILYFIMVLGLVIEAFSRDRFEDYHLQRRRIIVLVAMNIVLGFIIIPYILQIFDFLF